VMGEDQIVDKSAVFSFADIEVHEREFSFT
jgi:hypothetical protein